jgi:predicted Zn finger-like uncharacterized protein
MKISCQSCQSKYTIADDKVAGKVVKIRCKKCGATIVVNGSEGAAGPAMSYVPEMPAADAAWTVNVAEGDQRTLTDAEIVSAFQAGVVNEDTYCWRDGMADWLPLKEIEQLVDAVGATNAMQAPPVMAPAARGGSNGSAEPLAAAPAARRVAGARTAGGDLFSSAAQAGGEEDIMTSAPAGRPQSRPPAPPMDDKMTGERNENSVLFSLSALTSKGTGPTKPTTPGVEASGLIDIRQLSAQLHSSDDKKKSRIDDIMNLAGGGAFSPSLSGPILSAPAVSEYTAPEEAAAPAAQGRGRGVVIAAAGVGILVIGGAIGTAVMMMKKPEASDKDKASTSEVASAGAPLGTGAASAGPAASASVAAAAPSETAAPSASAAPTANDTPSAPSTPKVATNTAKPATKDTGGASPPPAKENSLAAAMAGGAAPAAPAAPAAAAGGSDQPFNMGEAKSRLAAAASAAQGCKKGDGPTGTGRVVVLFAPSGAAQSATVSGPPFEGTPTGACVAGRFRGVHVPAFSGSPFSVSKSFSIN